MRLSESVSSSSGDEITEITEINESQSCDATPIAPKWDIGRRNFEAVSLALSPALALSPI